MPSRRRRTGFLTASAEVAPHEAVVLFRKLRELGHITASQVHEAREAIAREISELTERLSMLRNVGVHSVPATHRAPAGRPRLRTSPRKSRSRSAVTSERRAIMALQGRYLGLMHKIPAKEMSKFKAAIAKKGKAAVVAEMAAYAKAHAKKQRGGNSTSRRRQRRA